MRKKFVPELQVGLSVLLAVLLVLVSNISLAQQRPEMGQALLRDFATRYAMAWSSQDPALLASFYTDDGVLQVNGGTPAVGRAAIAEKAAGFMEAFPDMLVQLESLEVEDARVVFRWLWTGTNTGPGGTGNEVRLRGYESWTFGSGGLIQESLGQYDEAEYQRQVSGAAAEP